MVIETKHGNKLWIVNADLMLVDHLIEPQDWIDNHRRSQCVVCLSKFSAFRRKHHCRTVSFASELNQVKRHGLEHDSILRDVVWRSGMSSML